jgi:four helix bundle protein
MSDKKSKIQTFEDLRVWQLARKIHIEIFELLKKFPSIEKYRLIDQMIRSSRSISDNISEGYGRFHYQENIQYCRQGRGSAYELKNQIITAFDCKYIDESEYKYHKNQIIECIQLLNGYIRYLKNAKNNAVREDEIPYIYDNLDEDPNNQ